ncbi:hypothetical protein J3R82DRAFT_3155 [Butyriboletus roseoflavus]|nr:hypothetical protein J3R82DRAFT_3155 [Butyriboletus roseoflavus]
MALNGQEILYFMSVGVSSTPIPDQSFEVRHGTLSSCLASLLMPGKELRMRDYLKAYQTTGRPPFPCPQSPDTPTARAAVGLPPLFVPAAIPVPSDSLSGTSSTSDALSALPTKPRIPLHQNHHRRAFRVYLRPDALQSLFARGWFPSVHPMWLSFIVTVGHPVAPRPFFFLSFCWSV